MNRPVEPDQFTETALRLLPIPTHAPSFWTDLDRALDEISGTTVLESEDRTDQAPRVPSLDLALLTDDNLALVPPALRRRSNALLVAVAAAAVVMVVFAGSSLVRERTDDGSVDLADADTASSELDRLVADAQPTSATVSAAHADASSDAVAAWVDALHDGDVQAAWTAMGPTSQEHFGSESAFEAELAAMDAELGGWAEVDVDEVLVTPVLAAADGTVAVVTLVGTTAVAGERAPRADAFPVRIVDGAVVLEPFAPAGALELVTPAPLSATGDRPSVGADDDLVIVVPAGVDAPVLRLDGADPVVCGEADGTQLRAIDDLPVQRCSYQPPAGIGAGEHTLTVAFMGADGASISAEALLFQAA